MIGHELNNSLGGTGVGLVLCRQILEAHGGGLTLENREDRVGCRARVRLPLVED